MARSPKSSNVLPLLVLSFLTGIGSTLGYQTNLKTEASKLGEEVTCMVQHKGIIKGIEGHPQPFANVQRHLDLRENETREIPVDGYPSYFQTGNSDLSQVCPEIARRVIPDYNPNSHRVSINPVK